MRDHGDDDAEFADKVFQKAHDDSGWSLSTTHTCGIIGQRCSRLDTEGSTSEMETLNTEQLSSRLRERLSEAAMLDLTKRLIAIPSENPPGNYYEECARTLLDELDRLGFDHVRREGASVLASVGTGPRTLYFSGHYDVVPAQSRDQFQPRVEGANLFGRGSSDMKSGLAAMIHAAAAARDEGLHTGRIGIVVVPDKKPLYQRVSRFRCTRCLGRAQSACHTGAPGGVSERHRGHAAPPRGKASTSASNRRLNAFNRRDDQATGRHKN
jgi:hypothetical protein